MKRSRLLLTVTVGLWVGFLINPTARADESMSSLRAELNALKAQYEARIQALEERPGAAEQQLALERKDGETQGIVQATPGATFERESAPADTRVVATGSEFNPAIGVILNGAARAYEKDPRDYYIPGAPAGGEAGLPDEGLSIGESEFVFTAGVDDWFFSRITLALEQEDGDFETSLEEAFVDTLSMPANTALRFGRFYSSVGYLNNKHAHTWDFADQALPYSVFLGSQYGDDGIQFRWLAPTDFYL